MASLNKRGCEDCDFNYHFDPSLGMKALREQIAVDFQVSPEAIHITVGKEVVSDSCGQEWMLEAIEKGKQFSFVVKKPNVFTKSTSCVEAFPTDYDKTSRVLPISYHGHQGLLDENAEIRLKVTVKQPSLNKKSKRKKISLKDLRQDMPLVTHNPWPLPAESPPVSPPPQLSTKFPQTFSMVPATLPARSSSEVAALASPLTVSVTAPYLSAVAEPSKAVIAETSFSPKPLLQPVLSVPMEVEPAINTGGSVNDCIQTPAETYKVGDAGCYKPGGCVDLPGIKGQSTNYPALPAIMSPKQTEIPSHYSSTLCASSKSDSSSEENMMNIDFWSEPPPSYVSVEEENLAQLQDMNFNDRNLNLAALRINQGDMDRAVDWLLSLNQ